MSFLPLTILSFAIFNLNTLLLSKQKNFKTLFIRIFPIEIGFMAFVYFGRGIVEYPYYFDSSSKTNDVLILLIIVISSISIQMLLWIKRKEDSIFLLNLCLFSISWLIFLQIFSPPVIFYFFCVFSILKLMHYFSIVQLILFTLIAICFSLSFFNFSILYFFFYTPYICIILNLILLGLNFKKIKTK